MVHPCDKPCGNKTASGYCATTACINPQYSNIGTAQYGQGVQKRIITNADRIRAMSDEELVAWFYSGDFPWCVYEEDVVPCTYEDIPCHPCDRCLLDWLKKEAE